MIDPNVISGISTDLMHGEFTFWYYLSIVVIVLALVLTLAGAFTMYFGSGKSRKIGGVLLGVGIVGGILYVLLASSYWPGDVSLIDAPIRVVIVETVVYLSATIIGAVVGLGIFLGAIMKA